MAPVTAAKRFNEALFTLVEKGSKSNDRVECKLCKKQFWSSGPSRTSAHLLQIPGKGVAACAATPGELESVQAELRAELEKEEGAEAHVGASKRPRTMPSSNTQQASAAGGSRQSTIPQILQRVQREAVDDAVVDHFNECGVPFRHASSPSFKRVTLLRFGAPYTPPGR